MTERVEQSRRNYRGNVVIVATNTLRCLLCINPTLRERLNPV